MAVPGAAVKGPASQMGTGGANLRQSGAHGTGFLAICFYNLQNVFLIFLFRVSDPFPMTERLLHSCTARVLHGDAAGLLFSL